MRSSILSAVFATLMACGGSSLPSDPQTSAPDAAVDVHACTSDVTAKAGTVITDRGAVTGARAGATWAYRGIPFATAARFRRPELVACWKGERAATAWGSRCAQLRDDGKTHGSEDCLSLNVWTPEAPAAPRAVMVFIHGGGHSLGAASQQLSDGAYIYDGESLATKGDVVVVTIQYRLGPLGWLAHPALAAEDPDKSSGMLGHLDQVAALQWVRDNVARFGGDPGKVTIFGESAGGVSVCSLVASPLAKGLFHGAIMESGGCPGKSRDQAEAHGKKVAEAAGCATAECLRTLPLEKLLTALPANVVVDGAGSDYTTVVDGYAMPSRPLELIETGKHSAVPFLFGSNTDETSRSSPRIDSEADYQAIVRKMFPGAIADQVLAQYTVAEYSTPRRAYVALTSDAKFVCPLRHVGSAFAKGQPLPTYRYVFGYVAENASPTVRALGAPHAIELLYVFDKLRVGGYTPTARDQALADSVMAHWTTFAKTGAVTWPKWERAMDPHLRFDVSTEAAYGVRTKQCDFWDGLKP